MGLVTKSKLVAIGRYLAAVIVVMSFTAPVFADQYDDQIAAIQAQIKAQQSQIVSLQVQQDTLENKIALLNAQIADTNKQLQLNQAKYDQLTEQLQAAEEKLAQKKAVLGESIRAIYLTADTTPIEQLASSNNFSEFVDKQQYLESLKSSVEQAIADVTVLKTQLEQQKKDQADLISQQQSLKAGLAAQRGSVSALLVQTQGQEAQYQRLVADNQQKLQAVIAARAEAIRKRNISFSSGGCGTGYPDRLCNAAQDSMDDGFGFFNRECVSYVAWRRDYENLSPQPNHWGNAADWYRFVDHYSNPQRGDIVVWGAYANPYIGWAGHVAYVESNNGDSITISQYNFDVGSGPGQYSRMTVRFGDQMLQGAGYIY